jgi:hypothetical protein
MQRVPRHKATVSGWKRIHILQPFRSSLIRFIFALKKPGEAILNRYVQFGSSISLYQTQDRMINFCWVITFGVKNFKYVPVYGAPSTGVVKLFSINSSIATILSGQPPMVTMVMPDLSVITGRPERSCRSRIRFRNLSVSVSRKYCFSTTAVTESSGSGLDRGHINQEIKAICRPAQISAGRIETTGTTED